MFSWARALQSRAQARGFEPSPALQTTTSMHEDSILFYFDSIYVRLGVQNPTWHFEKVQDSSSVV